MLKATTPTVDHECSKEHEHPPVPKFRANIVLLGFLAVGGFYLVTEHWAHLLGILPWLLLLACPLMHLFMHHGHHHHHSSNAQRGAEGGFPKAEDRRPV